MAFTSAYTDNAVGPVAGGPLSDVSYSVAPFLSLDETTSRLHWVLNYAPGFTFYQRLSSRNETDQNASIDLQYRLSPHVTFSARDGFQKSSNVFNQPDLAGVAVVAGGTQQPNFSVIAPVADRLSNFGNVGINYQFAANGMVGASGTFSNLHYPNQAQVPGLFDSNTQGGTAFYTWRVSKMHYIGATYQYQRLVAYPTLGQSDTQTHAVCSSTRFTLVAFVAVLFRRTAIFEYSATAATTLADFRSLRRTSVDSSGGRQPELARAIDQRCSELLAHHFRRRGVDRSGKDG